MIHKGYNIQGQCRSFDERLDLLPGPAGPHQKDPLASLLGLPPNKDASHRHEHRRVAERLQQYVTAYAAVKHGKDQQRQRANGQQPATEAADQHGPELTGLKRIVQSEGLGGRRGEQTE